MTIHRDPSAAFGTIPFEADPIRWMENSDVFEKPRQQRSRDALGRIIVAALRLFSESGFDATRVADVAAEAEVPVGTVYKHFADKDALLAAIVEGYRSCRMREIGELCTSEAALAATPRELVELHLDIVFSAFTLDSGLLRLIERRRLEDPGTHQDQSAANEIVAAASIAYTSIQRLLSPQPLEQPGLGLTLAVLASVINLVVGQILIRTGKQHDSITLEADGHHLMSDVWTSAGVVIGVTAAV